MVSRRSVDDPLPTPPQPPPPPAPPPPRSDNEVIAFAEGTSDAGGNGVPSLPKSVKEQGPPSVDYSNYSAFLSPKCTRFGCNVGSKEYM